MRHEAFRQALEGYPLISRPLLKLLITGDKNMEVQLSRWKKNGKLIRLAGNIFILNEKDRKINPSKLFLACEMVKPSYISLEYALSFHGLIPERVADLTCITTKKTRTLANAFGTFSYRHVKTECFTGFSSGRDEAGLLYYMAEPEKALVDFIYLNLEKFKPVTDRGGFLKESYRLQNHENLNKKKILVFAGLFKNKKLLRVVREEKL